MDDIPEEEFGEDGGAPTEHGAFAEDGSPAEEVEEELRPATAVKKKKRKKRARQNACLTMCKYDLVWDVARDLGWNLVEEDCKEGWNLFWTDMSVSAERAMKMNHLQRINHFPGMHEIARKNGLARNLNKIAKALPPGAFNFYPKTWILPSEAGDLYKQAQDKKVRTYICKPSKGCQGNGIFLTRNLDDIDPTSDSVVQRYLHKPLLVDNKKFDLRIYLLVTSVTPFRAYLFKEGMARFCTNEYTAVNRSNLSNQFMHLTNYAINKHNENYEFNEDENKADEGSKRTMSSVFAHLKEQGADIDLLWEQIKEICVKTCLAVQPSLAHIYNTCFHGANYGSSCFEILGFDVMMDHAMKPWLIEVNHTPSFRTDTPFDMALKHGVISSTFKMVSYTVEELRRIREHVASSGLGMARKTKEQVREADAEFRTVLSALRNQFEEANAGDEFELCYPSPDAKQQAEYETILQVSTDLFGNCTKTTGRHSARSKNVPADAKKGPADAKKGPADPKRNNDTSDKKDKLSRQDDAVDEEKRNHVPLPPSSRLLASTAASQAQRSERRSASRNVLESEQWEALPVTGLFDEEVDVDPRFRGASGEAAMRDIVVPSGVYIDRMVQQYVRPNAPAPTEDSMPPIPSAVEALQHSNRSKEMKNRRGFSGDKHSAATDALMRKPLHFQSQGLPKAVAKQSSRKVMVLQPTTLVCPNFGDDMH